MLCESSHACHADLSMSAPILARKCTACDGTSGRRPLAQRTIVSTSCHHVDRDGFRCKNFTFAEEPNRQVWHTVRSRAALEIWHSDCYETSGKIICSDFFMTVCRTERGQSKDGSLLLKGVRPPSKADFYFAHSPLLKLTAVVLTSQNATNFMSNATDIHSEKHLNKLVSFVVLWCLRLIWSTLATSCNIFPYSR